MVNIIILNYCYETITHEEMITAINSLGFSDAIANIFVEMARQEKARYQARKSKATTYLTHKEGDL